MVRFKGRVWTPSITRQMSFFHSCMAVVGSTVHAKLYGLPKKDEIYVTRNGRLSVVFWPTDDMEKYQYSLGNLCSSPNQLMRLSSTYHRLGSSLWHSSNALEKQLPSVGVYRRYRLAYERLTAGLSLTSVIGRHIPELLTARLIKLHPSYSNQKVELIISELTYPSEQTPLTKSQLSLLGIGAILQKRRLKIDDFLNYPEIRSQLRDYLKRYGAIPVNFCEDPWSEDDVVQQLRDILNYDCAEEWRKIIKNHNKQCRQTRMLLSRIGDTEIRRWAKALQIGTTLNEYRKFIFCRASLAYRPMFILIAKRCDLADWRECWKFTPDEVESLYFKKDRSALKILPRRKLTGVMYSPKLNTYCLLAPRELPAFLRESDHKPSIENKEKQKGQIKVNGVIANAGIIRGRAKIIMGRPDFDKFRDGDIIVTAMTSVDFVSIMRRAAAFVTNEGGITSHASIVSRELNKPCIIGTKIATKVFKDGDRIEVNANKGIVRILTK